MHSSRTSQHRLCVFLFLPRLAWAHYGLVTTSLPPAVQALVEEEMEVEGEIELLHEDASLVPDTQGSGGSGLLRPLRLWTMALTPEVSHAQHGCAACVPAALLHRSLALALPLL